MGKILGALIGFLITRQALGALIGALIGHMFDQSWSRSSSSARAGPHPGASAGPGSISEEFFRTTFEIMGHVAKSDGRVSEAEIDAARRLMQELRLGSREVAVAIGCFRAGKSPSYDAEAAVERLRQACGQRHDVLRAFVEVQLRAAIAGNGLSSPARTILAHVAEGLGISGLELAYMEASLRTWRRAESAHAGPPPNGRPYGSLSSLAECYAVLEVDSNISDQEVTKAYRRQMSRHHPDKLVANGLPESMAQLAKERTQRIQEAYEGIRAARGMR